MLSQTYTRCAIFPMSGYPKMSIITIYFRFPVANPMLIYFRNKASSIYSEQRVKKTTLWGLQCILRLKATCADPIPCNRATEEEEHDKHVLKNDPCCTHKFCIWHHAYRRGAAKDHKQILDLCTGSTQQWLRKNKLQMFIVLCTFSCPGPSKTYKCYWYDVMTTSISPAARSSWLENLALGQMTPLELPHQVSHGAAAKTQTP